MLTQHMTTKISKIYHKEPVGARLATNKIKHSSTFVFLITSVHMYIKYKSYRTCNMHHRMGDTVPFNQLKGE